MLIGYSFIAFCEVHYFFHLCICKQECGFVYEDISGEYISHSPFVKTDKLMSFDQQLDMLNTAITAISILFFIIILFICCRKSISFY